MRLQIVNINTADVLMKLGRKKIIELVTEKMS